VTFIVTFLVGLGGLLIASSLDCSSLKDTFTAIVQNKPIDWTGSKSCTPSGPGPSGKGGASVAACPVGIALIPAGPSGGCPTGYYSCTVSGGKLMCAPNPTPTSQWPQGWAPRCSDGTCHCNPFAPVPDIGPGGALACRPR
jgi:hypothetical protein